MTQNHLTAIDEQLQRLGGYASFRLKDGLLRESLAEILGSAIKEESGDSVPSLALEVQIAPAATGREALVRFTAEHQGTVHRGERALSELEVPALEELATRLAGAPEGGRNARPRPQIRMVEDMEAYDQAGASARLRVSPEWLKSVIPCSNYTYDEIDGKKIIREYFWYVELVENLSKLKRNKTTPEDVKYIAEQCCFGDLEWAKDLIGRLKSPNRVEQPKPQSAKAQPPRGQQKGGRPMPRDRMHARQRGKKQVRET